MFVRNGPNPQFAPKGRYHWFDGDGMLHGVRLQGGRASYRNRYVRTRGFALEREAGQAIWTGLTEMPNFADPPHGMMFKNTGNTALVWHDKKLLALWEGGEPHQIRLPELDTVGLHDYGGALHTPVTAHPKVDPVTGEMLFFGYQPMGPDFLLYSVVSADGKLQRTVPIRIPRGVMMHDFAVTARYSIFLDLPLVFDPRLIMEGKAPFHFDRDQPARFGIVPRHGDDSQVRWFETPPCYIFHTLDAWDETGERGDAVVLLACRLESTMVASAPPGHSTQAHGHGHGNGRRGRDDDHGRMHRWRFDLGTGEVTEQALDDAPSDFPRCHEGRAGHRTRFGYTARFAPGEPGGAPLFDALLKYDHERGTSVGTHAFGPGRFGGEAVFVPRPGAASEDDGWLLTYVRDERAGESELLVVSARDISVPPVARVILPQRVPYGFHAAWVGAEQFG
jgi:carotenoid cleavage dioxygenase